MGIVVVVEVVIVVRAGLADAFPVPCSDKAVYMNRLVGYSIASIVRFKRSSRKRVSCTFFSKLDQSISANVDILPP